MDIGSVIESSKIIYNTLVHLDHNLEAPVVTNGIGEPHLNHYGISFHSGLYRPTSNELLDEKDLFFLYIL